MIIFRFFHLWKKYTDDCCQFFSSAKTLMFGLVRDLYMFETTSCIPSFAKKAL